MKFNKYFVTAVLSLIIMISTAVSASACNDDSSAFDYCLINREFTDDEIDKVKSFCESFYSHESNTYNIPKVSRYTLFRCHYVQRNMFLCVYYPDNWTSDNYPQLSKANSGSSVGMLSYINFPKSLSKLWDGVNPIAILFGFKDDFTFERKYQTLVTSSALFYPSKNSSQSLLYTDVPLYDVDGNVVNLGNPVTYNATVNDDYTVDLTANTTDDTQKYRVVPSIHNQKTEPCEATHIPYASIDDSTKYITPDDPYTLTVDLKDFQDKCQDMKVFSKKIYISFSIFSEDYNEYGGYFAVDIDDIFSTDSDTKGLFTEKKEYESFPDIMDYLDDDFPDIRDYVSFENHWNPDWVDVGGLDAIIDLLKNLWELIKSIALFLYGYLLEPLLGFFLWLWAVLKYIFFNFVGLFKYLGACLWTIVQNIVIALYNLVVDLRRLVIYLFVPSSKELYSILKDKFPSMTRVLNAITAGKAESDKSMTLNLFGKDFDFNFASIPDKLKNTLFTGSTVCLYVIQAFIVIKCLFKCFGVHVGGSGNSEED